MRWIAFSYLAKGTFSAWLHLISFQTLLIYDPAKRISAKEELGCDQKKIWYVPKRSLKYFSLVMMSQFDFSLKKSVRSQQTERKNFFHPAKSNILHVINPASFLLLQFYTMLAEEPWLRKSWHFKVKHPGSQAKLFWQTGSHSTGLAILYHSEHKSLKIVTLVREHK